MVSDQHPPLVIQYSGNRRLTHGSKQLKRALIHRLGRQWADSGTALHLDESRTALQIRRRFGRVPYGQRQVQSCLS